MEKIKTFFKASPVVLVIAGFFVAGVASAAILSFYGTMEGAAKAEQSVVFGNGDTSKTYTMGGSSAVAGNTYTQEYNLLNRSESTAPIKFLTNQCLVGGGHCGDTNHDEEGVETSYWSSVDLSQKNTTTWAVRNDGAKATLTYELVSDEFNYELEATGLSVGTEYSLVYYADKQDRFDNYGGDNPGALITTVTANADGEVSVEGNVDLGMNLPHSDDWNGTSDADYCQSPDNYNLCRGAKVWLVPSSDYDEVAKKIKDASWSNMGDFLWETDLIVYDDVDTDGEGLNLGKGLLNIFVKNILNVALQPGDYKVKTQIQPVI